MNRSESKHKTSRIPADEMLVELAAAIEPGKFTAVDDGGESLRDLSHSFPFARSVPDWGNIPGAITGHAARASELCDWLTFLDRVISAEGLCGQVTYGADGLFDKSLRFDAADLRSMASVILTYPYHHYFAGPQNSWVLCFLMEGGMGFGRSPIRKSIDVAEEQPCLPARQAGTTTAESHENAGLTIIRGVLYRNYSAEPLGKLLGWLPRDLQAEEVVFMPDVCPGKSPLPTGTIVKTRDPDWRRLAISDCGCGMQLLKTDLSLAEFQENLPLWDEVGAALKSNRGKLGDLGGGNHFLDALVSRLDDRISFLVHTGSRKESELVDHLVSQPTSFDSEFQRIVKWARENRDAVAEAVRSKYGRCSLTLDLPHNTFEKLGDGSVIIRKGAVAIQPGGVTVLPSHLNGDVAIVRATDEVRKALYSLGHGTGRTMARGIAKNITVDCDQLRRRVYIPDFISNSSFSTEGPHCYRDLDDCLGLVSGLATVEERFAVVAYLGHL